ncbi:PREDICTED: translocator protein [Ceratosolen solmsi marchali]|uniref:Translocator protein n=1 Tax=Ceratosolen solmsi marchali TaxID=326594 RepID=A0AAJ6YXT4_9HYME|nr:PREDICTED: translocator protein [Ceratosolen solmsi marchali]
MPVRISWPLVVAIVHPNVGGWLGSIITKRNLKPWYESLKKPKWTPPNWVYGPLWTAIYSSMGYASYLVLQDCGSWRNATLPLSIYGTNLALNWAWVPIFFGAHKIKWALYDMIALWGSTAILGVTFYRINTTAGLLIAPYLAWNTLVTVLNYVLYRDNKANESRPTKERKEK